MPASPLETFDSEIGMWVVDSTSQEDEKQDDLAREAERLISAERARCIAEEVASETAAWEWLAQAKEDDSHQSRWVAQGMSLLEDVWRKTKVFRGRLAWGSGTASDLTAAPWGILTSTSMPLGSHFHPRDMLKLRGVCYSFRGGLTTGQFFGELLCHLGVPLRYDAHPPHALFELACRIFEELKFVHSVRDVAARAIGLAPESKESENLCCVAGSHALNRFLILDDAAQHADNECGSSSAGGGGGGSVSRKRARGGGSIRGHRLPSVGCAGVEWTPGDIRVFVSCRGSSHSAKSVAAFKAVVHHAAAAATSLFHPSRVSRSDDYSAYPYPFHRLPMRHPNRLPIVTVSNEYDTLSNHHDANVATAMRGCTYERGRVLSFMQLMGAPSTLIDAVSALPHRLGATRPMRVVRMADVRMPTPPFERPNAEGRPPQWPMPKKITVIQYMASGGAPLDPRSLVSAFDLVPCMVSMRVDASLKVQFAMPPEAREAIKRRELRLSRYSFGPAHDASQESVEDATLKQIRRIARYQRYGFELHAGL